MCLEADLCGLHAFHRDWPLLSHGRRSESREVRPEESLKGVRLHQVVMAITAAVWGVLSLLENQHSPWHLELPGLEVECVENK